MFVQRSATRSKLAIAGILAVGGLVLGGCSSAESSPEESTAVEPVNWDMMVVAGPNPNAGDSIGNLQQEFADRVKEETDGVVNITLRAPGELPYQLSEVLSTVGANRVTLGDPAAFASGESPTLGILTLPFLASTLDDYVEAYEVLQPYLQDDYDKYGIEPIFYYAWPQQSVWGKGEAPKRLQDLSGRSIRASSAPQSALLTDIGANPTTLDTGEVGTALDQNVVTAIVTSAYNARPLGWGEGLDWGYLTNLGFIPGVVFANSEQMSALPQDIQDTVRRVGQETGEKMLAKIPAQEESDRQALADESGLQLVDGDPADEAYGLELMEPFWEQWASENGVSEALTAVREALGR